MEEEGDARCECVVGYAQHAEEQGHVSLPHNLLSLEFQNFDQGKHARHPLIQSHVFEPEIGTSTGSN